jgi:hypothetical protein
LILKKHKAHAEEDEIIIILFGRKIGLHGCVMDVDEVFEPVTPDELFAMSQVLPVDVDARDPEIF